MNQCLHNKTQTDLIVKRTNCTKQKHSVPLIKRFKFTNKLRFGGKSSAVCFAPLRVNGENGFGRHRAKNDGSYTVVTVDGFQVEAQSPLVISKEYRKGLIFNWPLFANKVDVSVVRLDDDLVYLQASTKRKWWCKKPKLDSMWASPAYGDIAIRKETDGDDIFVSAGRVGTDTACEMNAEQWDIVSEVMYKAGAQASGFQAGAGLEHLGKWDKRTKMICQTILAATEQHSRIKSIPLQSSLVLTNTVRPFAFNAERDLAEQLLAIPGVPDDLDTVLEDVVVTPDVVDEEVINFPEVPTHEIADDEVEHPLPQLNIPTILITPPDVLLDNACEYCCTGLPCHLPDVKLEDILEYQATFPKNYARHNGIRVVNGIEELIPPQYAHPVKDRRDELSEDRKPTGRWLAPHFVEFPAEFPLKSWGNDMAAVHYRIDPERNKLKRIKPKYYEWAKEFVQQVKKHVGRLEPWTLDAVLDHQTTPIQRARNAKAVPTMLAGEPRQPQIEAMMKIEATGNRAAVRNISTINADHNLNMLRYMLPIQEACKKHMEWYCSGLPPKEIEQRLLRYCNQYAELYASDETKMDAHFQDMIDIIIVEAVCTTVFGCNEPAQLLKFERKAKAKTSSLTILACQIYHRKRLLEKLWTIRLTNPEAPGVRHN